MPRPDRDDDRPAPSKSALPLRFRGAPSRSRGFAWAPARQRGRAPQSASFRPPASGSNAEPLGTPGERPQKTMGGYRGRGRGKTATKSSSRSALPSKMSIRPAGRRLPPWASGRDPLDAGGLRLPSKSQIYSRNAEQVGMRRKRDMDDIGARSLPRMMTSSTPKSGPSRQHHPGGPRKVQSSARKEGFYIEDGKLHRLKADVIDSDSDEDPVEMTGAARKTIVRDQRGGSHEVHQIAAKSITARKSAARKEHDMSGRHDTVNAIEISDTEPENPNTDNVSHLLFALSALSINERQMHAHSRLPFLKRSVRIGFLARCRLLCLPTVPAPPLSPVRVTYRYLDEEDEEDVNDDAASGSSIGEYETKVTSMSTWLCPLCTTFGELPTQEVLQFHLEDYHSEVDIDWSKPKTEQGEWKIYLTIPPPVAEADVGAQSEDEDEDPEPEPEPEPDVHEIFVISDSDGDDSDAVVEISPPLRPTAITVEPEPEPVLGPEPEVLPPTQSPRRTVQTIAPPVLEIRHKLRPPSPPVFPIVPTETVEPARPPSYRGSLPERYPSPPPPSNPEGPAAQYPYLYVLEKDGEVPYSCRPSGPKIYDLLNSLPLEPFGVLSWMIVDREEDLYELEHVNDEDKSMLALWNRWIMLNRVKFVFEGHLAGVKDFLDEYWRMIHLAAGWGALRAFLLMLMTNRYLTVSEVAQALKYYEEKTGMQFWYQEAAERNDSEPDE